MIGVINNETGKLIVLGRKEKRQIKKALKKRGGINIKTAKETWHNIATSDVAHGGRHIWRYMGNKLQ